MTLTAVVMLACAVQWLCATAAIAAEVSVVAVVRSATGGHVTLAVDVTPVGPTRIPPELFSVTTGGVRQSTQTVPVIRDRMPIALIMDASAAGAPALQAGLSGAASLLLQAPSTSRFAVIADNRPPVVVAAPGASQTDALSGLSGITARGDRSTSEALSIVTRELGAQVEPSVIVLHTGAPDAGGEPAAHLAARLAQARVVLTVVATAADTMYWAQVANATGGVLVAAQPQAAIDGFDRVAETMRARYLLTFPTPKRLPARVSVQIRNGSEIITVDAVVPESSLTATKSNSDRWGWQTFLTVSTVTVVLAITVVLIVRRVRGEDAQFSGDLPVRTGRW